MLNSIKKYIKKAKEEVSRAHTVENVINRSETQCTHKNTD